MNYVRVVQRKQIRYRQQSLLNAVISLDKTTPTNG